MPACCQGCRLKLETIIIRTDEHNAANHVEDGQFTTFLPLTDEQEKDITDKGVTLERMYSLDIKAEDGSSEPARSEAFYKKQIHVGRGV